MSPNGVLLRNNVINLKLPYHHFSRHHFDFRLQNMENDCKTYVDIRDLNFHYLRPRVPQDLLHVALQRASGPGIEQ